jgi:hypothetical protein
METPSSSELGLALRQREQALACALLALILISATLLSNFGPQPDDLGKAQAALLLHRDLVIQHRMILQANEAELARTQAELERLIRSVKISP